MMKVFNKALVWTVIANKLAIHKRCSHDSEEEAIMNSLQKKGNTFLIWSLTQTHAWKYNKYML